MTFRFLVAAGAAIASLAVPAASRGAADRDLVVVSRGAAQAELNRQAYLVPYAATGAAVRGMIWNGGMDALRAGAGSDDGGWDVVQVSGDELAAGCAAGLFAKPDWQRLGRDRYLSMAMGDCGVGAVFHDNVLSWDRDKFPNTPGWSDFWDVARYPGKRGLHRGVRGNLEIALMADGVAPNDVYRILRTEDGVDRAFRRLDQLKPYLVWWNEPAEAARLLGSGEVLMTSASNEVVARANAADHRFGIQWSGSLIEMESWAVVKRGNARDAVTRFLLYAGQPRHQKRLIAQIPFGATARGAEDGLPPEVSANSPSYGDNLKSALPTDEEFWRDNLDRLSGRFDAWLSR